MTDDPFEVLGVEARFDLTASAIERAYLRRAATAHPDSGGDDADAARRMAALNGARSALRDGESRARALLAREGLVVSDDRSLPDGFLESMLETRMDIEDAIASGDEAERDRWVSWSEARRSEHAARIEALFNSLSEPSADRVSVGAEIRVELNAWRYIERLIEQLDPEYDPQRADFA